MGKYKTFKTPEAAENHCIGLAYELVQKKLIDGTATSQEVCHFLKLATTREQLENEKLRSDLEVANAKIKQIEQSTKNESDYQDLLMTFKRYSGNFDDERDDEDDY